MRNQLSTRRIDALDRGIFAEDAVGKLTLGQAWLLANSANYLLCNCHGHPN
ncbi:hypothetical protein [Bradyrhizobium sp. UFLA03-84]|uniref:hypothetical protein n=1 Tax=Bradyrhizobium sp. UFLA03-84 TaxID=418599 RepID=UPI0013042A11|nr:hypothetical protein [Bradyrhizobium sp. UFLA03-84]